MGKRKQAWVAGKFPYTGLKVYGPYVHKTEKRRMVVTIDKRRHRSSTSYARFLYETHYRVKLPAGAVVDHIDGDPMNDELENLRVLSCGDNTFRDRPGRLRTVLQCPGCRIVLDLEHGQTHLSKGGTYTACSRSCNGKVSSGLRHGRLSVGDVTSGNVLHVYRRERPAVTLLHTPK